MPLYAHTLNLKNSHIYKLRDDNWELLQSQNDVLYLRVADLATRYIYDQVSFVVGV